MIVKVQESAKKDLKKLDKHHALKILKQLQKLEEYPYISNY